MRTAGRGGRRGLDQILVHFDELERGRKSLTLDVLIADELQQGGVTGGRDDWLRRGDTADAAVGAAVRCYDDRVT